MDEYLFLVVAKLKADQRKAERERREQSARELSVQPARNEAVAPRAVRGHGKKWFSKLEWREQA